MKKWKLLTAVALSAGLFLAGCSSEPAEYGSSSTDSASTKSDESSGKGENELVVAIQSDPSGLDPHIVTDRAAGIAIENLYNTLFTYTENYGEVEPSLVESYDISDDGLVYTLHLHDGVKFHSGNTMTSADVKYSLERIKDSGARASQLEKISAIETPDENTVEITLDSQYAPFLTYLANPLNAIVDQGCTVEDVIVEHPIYGQLTGPLHLTSRYEVSQFISRSAKEDARPLSNLTEGIHLHTVTCPDEDAFRRVKEKLRELGILLEN